MRSACPEFSLIKSASNHKPCFPVIIDNSKKWLLSDYFTFAEHNLKIHRGLQDGPNSFLHLFALGLFYLYTFCSQVQVVWCVLTCQPRLLDYPLLKSTGCCCTLHHYVRQLTNSPTFFVDFRSVTRFQSTLDGFTAELKFLSSYSIGTVHRTALFIPPPSPQIPRVHL